MRDLVQHAYILSHGSCSYDCSQLVCILFVIRIVCHITSKMGKTIAKLLCFGLFAGAWAHHEGLRRLKPYQFQRTAYWHCEYDKLRPDARFQLLVVCGSGTRGHRANEPCQAGFNFHIWKFQSTMKVTGKHLVYYWSLVRNFHEKHEIGWR